MEVTEGEERNGKVAKARGVKAKRGARICNLRERKEHKKLSDNYCESDFHKGTKEKPHHGSRKRSGQLDTDGGNRHGFHEATHLKEKAKSCRSRSWKRFVSLGCMYWNHEPTADRNVSVTRFM